MDFLTADVVSKTVHQTVGNSCPSSPRVDFWTLLTSSHVSVNNDVRISKCWERKNQQILFLWYWCICILIYTCICIWIIMLSPDSRLVPQVANFRLVTAGRSLLYNYICICISRFCIFLLICISLCIFLWICFCHNREVGSAQLLSTPSSPHISIY